MATAETLAPVVFTLSATSAATNLVAASNNCRTTNFAVQNNGTAVVYIGGSAVTTSAGLGIAAGETLVLGEQTLRTAREIFDASNYWAVTGAGGSCSCIIFWNRKL